MPLDPLLVRGVKKQQQQEHNNFTSGSQGVNVHFHEALAGSAGRRFCRSWPDPVLQRQGVAMALWRPRAK